MVQEATGNRGETMKGIPQYDLIIIGGPKWPEPVEIKKVDYTGDYVHIVGSTTPSKLNNVRLPISIEFLPIFSLNITVISVSKVMSCPRTL